MEDFIFFLYNIFRKSKDLVKVDINKETRSLDETTHKCYHRPVGKFFTIR